MAPSDPIGSAPGEGAAMHRRGGAGTTARSAVDWDEVRAILTDAYRKVAPKTLLKQLDAEG